MSIEYVIDYPCRPKKEKGEEHLFNLVRKSREMAPKKTVGAVESAQILEVPREGTEDSEARMRKDIAELDYFLSDCLSCPANAASNKAGSGQDAAFGCLLELNFPISKLLETGVLNAGLEAMQNPASNPGSKLVIGILKSHAKGRKTPAHKLRKMGKDYFASRAPLAARVTFEGKQVPIDTDQLMTLLMLGPVPPQATGAFAVLLERGIERSKREGITDPWVLAPLKLLADHMRAASAVGRPVKIHY